MRASAIQIPTIRIERGITSSIQSTMKANPVDLDIDTLTQIREEAL